MHFVHLGCSLKQTGVEIENITWVSLTTGWSSQQERHLTISNSLLREIIVDNQGVLSIVTEVFTDGASRVWSQELKWSCLRSSGCYDDRVLKTVSALKKSDNVGDGGSLLTDSDIDAIETLRVFSFLVDRFLVEDSVNSNGCLSGLSVSNDKFTLASSNWDLL